MDPAHEAHYPHPGLALQRRSHGDGLHAQVLRSRSRRHLERSAAKPVATSLRAPLQYEAGATASSGYAGIPNSGTSRPSSSTSGATRMLFTLLTDQKTTYVAPNAQAAYRVAPMS